MAFRVNFKEAKPLESEEVVTVLKESSLDLTKSEFKKDPSEEELKQVKIEKQELRKTWAISGNSNLVAAATQPVPNSELVKAQANFFEVTLKGSMNLWRYSITLGKFKKRQPTSKMGKRAFIQYMLDAAKKEGLFITNTFATDYDSIIISSGRLFEEGPLQIAHQPYPKATKDKYVVSTVQSLGSIDFRNLKELVNPGKSSERGNESVYLPDEDIRALNVVSWKKINDSSWKGGRVGNKFYPEELWERELVENENQRKNDSRVKHKRNVGRYWLATGFFTSIRPGQNSLLLNVNVTTSAFYANINVQNWIDIEKKEGVNELIGRKVIFSKDPDKKQRIIRHIDLEEPINQKGFVHEKTEISVVQHLEKEYRFNIESSDKTISVNCGPPGGRREWYPANYLNIVPWQHVQGKIDKKFDGDMVKVSERKPDKVRELIRQHALKHLDVEASDTKFGLQITSDLKVIAPRRIVPPEVIYGSPASPNTVSANTPNESDKKTRTTKVNIAASNVTTEAKWNLEGVEEFSESKVDELKALYFIQIGSHDNASFGKFRDILADNLVSYGILSKTPPYFQVSAKSLSFTDKKTLRNLKDAPETRRILFNHAMDDAYLRVMKETHGQAREKEKLEARAKQGAKFNEKTHKYKKGEEPPLLFIIFPKKDETTYSDVKWWGDCIRGIPTMCITYDTIFKALGFAKEYKYGTPTGLYLDDKGPDRMMFANICLKINFKLGGRNHDIKDGLGLRQNTMVVGADVTHYTSPDSGCPSLAGVVACAAEFWDEKLGMRKSNSYLASARLQPNKTEFIEQLKEMMEERLQAYKKINGSYPEHILFYRDGVGDSQYGMVHDHELPQIEEAARNIAGPNAIRITLLVVGKRHHARFFRMPNDRVKNTNFDGGICVNTEVVAPRHFNFYLQSHDSPLATARNAHYVVIKNESNYSAKDLQDVTNRLCYTGSRATRAQSTCIPVKYADLLCTRLRCYMRPVHEGATIKHIQNGEIKDYASQRIIWYAMRKKEGVKKSRKVKTAEDAWEYNMANPWRDDKLAFSRTMFYL